MTDQILSYELQQHTIVTCEPFSKIMWENFLKKGVDFFLEFTIDKEGSIEIKMRFLNFLKIMLILGKNIGMESILLKVGDHVYETTNLLNVGISHFV